MIVDLGHAECIAERIVDVVIARSDLGVDVRSFEHAVEEHPAGDRGLAAAVVCADAGVELVADIRRDLGAERQVRGGGNVDREVDDLIGELDDIGRECGAGLGVGRTRQCA